MECRPNDGGTIRRPISSRRSFIWQSLSSFAKRSLSACNYPTNFGVESSGQRILWIFCLRYFLGHDTHGRVRIFGKGPSPTEVFGKKNMKSYEQHARDLERVREEGRKQGQQEGWEKGREDGLEEGRKKYMDRLERVEKILKTYNLTTSKSPNEKSVHVQKISVAQSSHHQFSDSSDFMFEVGMKVDLLGVKLPKKVVAKAILISKDPEKKLGGASVGDGFWVVQIIKAILPNEDLLIGRGKMRKVGHAIKQIVAWRKFDASKNYNYKFLLFL